MTSTPAVGDPTVTEFAYDDAGNRVAQTAGTGEEAVTTTYLIDDNNLTGYSQTLEQTDRDDSDAVVKKTTYVVGPDVTGQYVTEDSTTAGAIYLQDAHGSTRGLYATTSAALLNAALVTAGGSTWTKTLTYDAYGNAVGFDPATAITELLYNGESFNSRTGQQYLRARWYDSASGRFGSMDPMAGSIYLPLSLNVYNYCHSSPIFHIDPSGRATLAEVGAGVAVSIAGFATIMMIQAWHPVLDQFDQRYRDASDRYPNDFRPTPFDQYKELSPDMQQSVWYQEGVFANQQWLASVTRAHSELLLAKATDGMLHGIGYGLMIYGGIQSVRTAGVQAYEVGTADALSARSVVGDALDIHHVGQAHPFEQLIPGYSRATGPVIALPEAEHALVPALRGTTTLTPRQALARNMWDLRNYTNAPNSSLEELIELNKQMYPGVFNK